MLFGNAINFIFPVMLSYHCTWFHQLQILSSFSLSFQSAKLFTLTVVHVFVWLCVVVCDVIDVLQGWTSYCQDFFHRWSEMFDKQASSSSNASLISV